MYCYHGDMWDHRNEMIPMGGIERQRTVGLSGLTALRMPVKKLLFDLLPDL
jgi:hypothetical protein